MVEARPFILLVLQHHIDQADEELFLADIVQGFLCLFIIGAKIGTNLKKSYPQTINIILEWIALNVIVWIEKFLLQQRRSIVECSDKFIYDAGCAQIDRKPKVN